MEWQACEGEYVQQQQKKEEGPPKVGGGGHGRIRGGEMGIERTPKHRLLPADRGWRWKKERK